MNRFKYFTLFSLLTLLNIGTLYSQNTRNVTVYSSGEQRGRVKVNMPVFPNGNYAMWRFIDDNLTYPADALTDNIEGRVILKFTVTREGNIENIWIIRNVDPLLDKEAVRIVSIMPKWTPGKINGELADIEYTLPILFTLPNNEKLADDMKIIITE